MIRVADIQRAVCEHYGVPLASMTKPMGRRGRSQDDAHPRQVAMLLAYRITGHTLTRIGQMFGGRDHSTVIHACRTVEQETCARTRRDLRSITLRLIHNRAGNSLLVASAKQWA